MNEATRFMQVVARSMPGEVTPGRTKGLDGYAKQVAQDFSADMLTTTLARRVGERIGNHFPTYDELANAISQSLGDVACAGPEPYRGEAEMYADVFGKMLVGTARVGGKTIGFKNPRVAASMARANFPKEALDILRQRFPDLFPPERCADRPMNLRTPRLGRIPPVPQSHEAPPVPDPPLRVIPLPDDVLRAERAKLKIHPVPAEG